VKTGDNILDAPKSELKFPANQTIELTALPRYGYRFTGWSGDSILAIETVSVTMTCTKNLTANFAPIKYRLLTIASPADGGEIILKPSQPQDGYEFGTEVTITARAAQGFVFKEWAGNELSTTGNITSYIVASDKSITAVFMEKSSNIWVWVWSGVGVIAVGVLLYILVIKKR
jgi:uncharacterized repeat protein (TIGR02543 family)